LDLLIQGFCPAADLKSEHNKGIPLGWESLALESLELSCLPSALTASQLE
jgi:hypothetical protein